MAKKQTLTSTLLITKLDISTSVLVLISVICSIFVIGSFGAMAVNGIGNLVGLAAAVQVRIDQNVQQPSIVNPDMTDVTLMGFKVKTRRKKPVLIKTLKVRLFLNEDMMNNYDKLSFNLKGLNNEIISIGNITNFSKPNIKIINFDDINIPVTANYTNYSITGTFASGSYNGTIILKTLPKRDFTVTLDGKHARAWGGKIKSGIIVIKNAPTNYIISIGDPHSWPPVLYDSSFKVPIYCDLDGAHRDCGETDINSKIVHAWAEIKNIKGEIVQKFDLIKENSSFFSLFAGNFDYSVLLDEYYSMDVYAEDLYGQTGQVINYSLFSGQGWNLCTNTTDCKPQHSCINNKCILDDINYQLGMVYVYSDQDTYNLNWQAEFSDINQKVVNGVNTSLDNKVNLTIDILGEISTDIFSWNPARVGGKFELINGGISMYKRIPASSFGVCEEKLIDWTLVESYCNNCIIEDGVWKSSASNLLCSNQFRSAHLEELNQQISQTLSFDFSDYDGVFVIFGKLGKILPNEDNKNLIYRCDVGEGVIGGYGDLTMAENSIKSGGLVDCHLLDPNRFGFYDHMGWHFMVHEILHRFGAVDVYDTGTIFGYDPSFYRNRARMIDPLTDTSIMGNGDLLCSDHDYAKPGFTCTQLQLDNIYIDKYNRQKIGL